MFTKKSLSKFLLLALEKSVDGSITTVDFLNHYPEYLRGYPRNLTKSRFTQALKRIREKGWIEILDDEEILIRLTDRGRNKIIWERINESKDWDGKWRMVVFDIPEKRRQARDLLRYKLKEWGFIKWQKSLWVTKKDCTQVMRNFINQVGIQDWVIVVESDNVGR